MVCQSISIKVTNIRRLRQLSPDLLSSPISHYNVWSVMTAHRPNLTPLNRDERNVAPHFQAERTVDHGYEEKVCRHNL